MSELHYVGLDLGMGAIKVYGQGGGVQVVSQVSSNGAKHMTEGVLGLKRRQRPMEVSSAYGSFYVGSHAHDYGVPVENLDFDRLTGTAEIRTLLYAALAKYQVEFGIFEKTLAMLVGLPFQMMSGEEANDFKKGVRGWMNGIHAWNADGVEHNVTIEIPRKGLVPQALGALFDFTHNEKGVLLPENAWALKEEIGVLSIGFNTIELLVTQQMSEKGRFTTGIQMGVRRLLEDINHSEYEDLYTLGELDMMLRNGQLKGKKAAVRQWSDRVTGAIESRWGRTFKRFAKVLVVGGGAEILRDYLTAKFKGKAVVLQAPVMSISKGLYKMALRFKK